MQCPRRDEKYHRHGPSTVPKDADDGGERLKGVARHKKPAASLLARPSTFYHGYPYPALSFAMSFARMLTNMSDRSRRCYQPLAQTQLGMTGSADERKRLGGDQRAACFVSRGAGVTRRRPDRV
ncbi:LOW QUALITY PROTEIN: hypothetical protein N5P37_002480 [Trichoderma harzianum]|nr:LOW QUALITY PROTEIN: hypothetical protein N5P37_002480 [Trichoderma harzianum]